MGKLFTTSIILCTLVTAFRYDLFRRDCQSFFRRSLPGSLVIAPEGAVGDYQPPPGPVTYNPLPMQTWPVAGTVGTTSTPTTTQDISHEPEVVKSDGKLGTNAPRKNIAILTGTVTKTQAIMAATQTAMAGRDIVVTSASLALSVFFAAVLIYHAQILAACLRGVMNPA
ncbi:hypothetical protein EYZ11_003701 [Aspergillus tanneri]|uniref:Uncharacterized protein n=1 Tax=Aspergillus tanneri TaxID=1220188 RepID=A0A4S3JMN2_9EURO|nr:hypothetical protein EYZ11_003701 [Aspergillus tanneri]